MFEGFKSSLKSAFSFGNKSPEAAKPIALAPQVETHNSVSDVMDDRAMDAWARGEGWNTKAAVPGRLNKAFDLSGKDAPDLSAFSAQALFKDEARIVGRLDNVVLDMPQTETQKFKVDTKAGNGGWFGERAWPTRTDSKLTEHVDSPSSVFAAFGDASRFDETPLTQEFLEAARDEVKVKPVSAPRIEAANDDFEYAGTKVIPFRRKAPTVEEAIQLHPPMRPGEGFSREPRGAVAMRLAKIAAAIMAVVGGYEAVSHSTHHEKHSSYSVDNIVPINNDEARNAEAVRAEKLRIQKVNPLIEVAQN